MRLTGGFILRTAAFAVMLVLAGHGLAHAQFFTGSDVASEKALPQIPENYSKSDIDRFMAPLSDGEARRLLRQSLENEATATPDEAKDGSAESGGSAGFMLRLRTGSQVFSNNLGKIIADIPNIGATASHAFTLLTTLKGWPRFGLGVINLIAMVLGGAIAALLVRRLFEGFARKLNQFHPRSLRDKFGALLVRGGLTFAELVAFFTAGQIISLTYFDRYDPMRLFLLAWFSTIIAYACSRIIARILFSPAAPHLRLIDCGDETATTIFRGLTWSVTIAAFAAFNTGALQLLGVSAPLLNLWQIVCGGAALATLLATLWRLRAPASAPSASSADSRELEVPEIEPGNDPSLGRFVSQGIGHRSNLLVFVGLIILYGLWIRELVSGRPAGATAAVVVVLALAMAAYLKAFRLRESVVPDHDIAPASTTAFNVVALFLRGIALLALLQAIGLDLVGMAQTPFGRDVTDIMIKIAVALFVAMIIWAVFDRIVQRFIAREHASAMEDAGDHADEGGSGVVVSRLGTLLPIFRGFALALISVITLMVVLSSIGINIGPLLAGAGVVGVAIGFGAQTLVKDILSGIFFLIDDAFRLGEYVEFDKYRGEVERISIRSMRLRHHRGLVHTVPFGELKAITNHNRDWVIYKQEFQLPYETDLEKVRKIIKKIGQELMEDPEHGQNLLMPVKSQGVRRVENGVLVVGTKFMCKPREQFVLRRIVYQRVRDRLYENGIHLAHRRVQIELPAGALERPGGDPSAAPNQGQPDQSTAAASIAAAAAAAIADVDETATARDKKDTR